MGESILLWGAGGHAQVVADLVRSTSNVVAGFVDRDSSLLHNLRMSDRSIRTVDEDELRAALAKGERLPCDARWVLPAVGANRVRFDMLSHVRTMLPPALVHPCASISPSASAGAGTVAFSSVVVNARARIGACVILNTGAIVEH